MAVAGGKIFDLSGKVAIMTGASSGLGASFARVLADAGAQVVLAARRKDRIEDLAKEIGEAAAPFVCDVTVDSDLAATVAFACERFGGLHILVNSAGISEPHLALEEDPADFRRVIDINLTSVFVACQAAAKEMVKLGSGSIINIASIAGLVASGTIPQAGYTASKAGVVNMTRELAVQWAQLGVRVNAIAPGWFPSEMTSVMFEQGHGLGWMERNTPMRRGGRLEELAGVLLLLASGAGSFITGQTIVVDGGWTLL